MPFANFLSMLSGALEIYLLCGSFWAMIIYNQMITIESPYFGSMCSNGADNATTISFCQERSDLFQSIFTVGVLCMSHGALVQGLILDNFGLFPLRLVGGCCFLLFFTTLLLVPNYPMVYWFSVAILGCGQYSPLMTGFPITSIFPSQQATITTLYSGLFDASGSFLIVVKKLYANGTGMSFETIVLFFIIVTGLMCLRTFFLLPAKGLPPVLKRPENYSIADDSPIRVILNQKTKKSEMEIENEEIEMESLRNDNAHEEEKTNICSRLFNLSFILNTFWFCVIAAFITWRFTVLEGWLNWFFVRDSIVPHKTMLYSVIYTSTYSKIKLINEIL